MKLTGLLALLFLSAGLFGHFSVAQVPSPVEEDVEEEQDASPESNIEGYAQKTYLSVFTDYADSQDMTAGLSMNSALDKLSKIGLSLAKTRNLEDSSILNTLEYYAYMQRKFTEESQFGFSYRHLRQKREFNTHRLALTYTHTFKDWELEVSPEFRFIVFGLASGRATEANTTNSGINLGVTYFSTFPWELFIRYSHYFYDVAAQQLSSRAASSLSTSGYLYTSGFLRGRAASGAIYHFSNVSLDFEYSLSQSYVDDGFTHSLFAGALWLFHSDWSAELRSGVAKTQEQPRVISVSTAVTFAF